MSKSKSVKKASTQDWHNADIKSALEKAGWSLRKLSLHHGYASPNTLHIALQRAWPKAERLIAAAIGVDAETIWPSRYATNDNTARSPRNASAVRNVA